MHRNNHLIKIVRDNKAEEISMLIRHAPRHGIPEGAVDHHDISLTPRGRVMAYEFGQQLFNDMPVRLFYSPIPRCKETAEWIRKGVVSKGGAAALVGERAFLDTHAIVDLKKMVHMMEEIGGMKFVQKWLDGKIERTVMNDPYQVVSKIVKGIASSKREKRIGHQTIDIHVTHDLNIISARKILLGVGLEETGWADYLDGVVFVHYPDNVLATWEDIRREIDIS